MLFAPLITLGKQRGLIIAQGLVATFDGCQMTHGRALDHSRLPPPFSSQIIAGPASVGLPGLHVKPQPPPPTNHPSFFLFFFGPISKSSAKGCPHPTTTPPPPHPRPSSASTPDPPRILDRLSVSSLCIVPRLSF